MDELDKRIRGMVCRRYRRRDIAERLGVPLPELNERIKRMWMESHMKLGGANGHPDPTPQEIAICLPFITRQIELSAPKILVTMGAPATQTLLGQKEGILRLRGRWFEYGLKGGTIPALATLHPAYLLRQPSQKALAWRDLRALRAKLAHLA